MNFKTAYYHCNFCKKTIVKVENLFFVEDGTQRGFCSEECIEKYYAPLVKHYDVIDQKLREKLNIEDEGLDQYLDTPQYFDQLLASPSEIWKLENDLKEELFSFILSLKKNDEPVFLICLCHVFNHRPSFIYLLTATKNEGYLKEFRIGEQIKNVVEFLGTPSSYDETQNLSPEVIMDIDRKKSELLSVMLSKRKESDISYEQFVRYLDYFEETMRNPDEMYSYLDEEGDKILTHVKVHDVDNVPFFYFSVCMLLKMDNGADALVPILSFPTIDSELTALYKRGELVSGVIQN